jgi:hypothetical protein
MSDDNYRQYVQDEVTAAQKSFKLGLISMAIVAVLILGYFQWLKSAAAEILEPNNLAMVMVSEVRRNMPTARDALEKNLTAAAPAVVTFITEAVMDEAIPLMTDAVTALLKDYSRELTGYGTLAVVQIFQEIVRDHRDALAKAAEGGEVPMYSPNKIAADLSTLIEKELGKRISEVPEETLSAKLDNSLVALQNINTELERMAKRGKRDTRQDDLGRKLITTWWTFLNRHESSADAETKMLDTIMKPVTSKDDPEVPGPE